jgi:hypothetical protein
MGGGVVSSVYGFGDDVASCGAQGKKYDENTDSCFDDEETYAARGESPEPIWEHCGTGYRWDAANRRCRAVMTAPSSEGVTVTQGAALLGLLALVALL